MKKCVLFLNGEIGYQALLTAINDPNSKVELVVLNEKNKQRDSKPIVNLCNEKNLMYLEYDNKSDSQLINLLRQVEPNFGFSCYFGHKLSTEVINLFENEIVNLHISLLPLNRGAHPVAWAIREGSEHGITLHKIDGKLDTGEILFQLKIPYSLDETGGSLYSKTSELAKMMIRSKWNDIRDFNFEPVIQNSSYTTHTIADFETLTILDLNHNGTLFEHLNMIRARCFSEESLPKVKYQGHEYSIFIRIEEIS